MFRRKGEEDVGQGDFKWEGARMERRQDREDLYRIGRTCTGRSNTSKGDFKGDEGEAETFTYWRRVKRDGDF